MNCVTCTILLLSCVYTTVYSVYMYILLLSMLCKIFYFAWVAQDLVSWNLHCTGVVCRLLKILQSTCESGYFPLCLVAVCESSILWVVHMSSADLLCFFNSEFISSTCPRSEDSPGLKAYPHWMRICPIQILIPIHFQRWFWSGSHNCALPVRTKKRHGMYVHVNDRQWVCFFGLHTVFHISALPKKQHDGWLEYRSDEGTMVAVWRCGHLKSMCSREFVPHNAVWTWSMHIELALGNSVTEPVWIRIQCGQAFMLTPWENFIFTNNQIWATILVNIMYKGMIITFVITR